MEYCIDASEHTFMTDEPEDSDEPYSYRGASDISVYVKSVSRSKPSEAYWGYHTVESDEDIPAGTPVFVVWAHYIDGDTFGSSGYWTLRGVFTDVHNAQTQKERDERKFDDTSARDNKNWRPWDGYFAHLVSVNITTLLMGA